jgi:hypothetical protein
MTIPCDPEETRAIAVAGMVLAYALVGMLKRVSVLDGEAIDNTLEAALSGVENALSPDDRSAALVRQLLDLMGRRLAAHVEPHDKRSARDERRLKSFCTANSELAHR